jgi:hypothetical protein
MIRSLGGASVSNCLQQALKSVFSIKVMAQANEGKTKKESIQKHGLQHSIISTAGFGMHYKFDLVQNCNYKQKWFSFLECIQTGSRKPKKFQMENDTRKIMKGMPDKYRSKCLAENQDGMDICRQRTKKWSTSENSVVYNW